MRKRNGMISTVLILLICWSGLIVPAAALPEEETPAGAAYLHEEKFPSDYSMTGLFSEYTKAFYAGDWDLRGASVTLRYSASQLVFSDLSSITLSLNGQLFYSGRVSPGTVGQVQELKVDLPLRAIQDGQNTLTINTYIRTREDFPCVDDVTKANWLQLYEDSVISISYYPKIPCNTIADCYEQFVSIDTLENKQSAVVLRPDADETELTAAAYVLTGISGQAQLSYENIGLVSAGDESSLFSGKYRIYICRYDSLPAGIKGRMTADAAQAVEDGQAVLQLLKSDNGSNVLLLTGRNGDALVNAARLFGNAAYLTQARTVWRKVAADEDVLMEKSVTDEYVKLTDAGAYVHGAFRQSANFYISFPENRVLAYSSQISLSMRYAENLDFDRSLVTVYINDKPVGSKKLQKNMAQGDSVVLDIPADLQVSGNFTVRVSFDLEIKDLWCTLRQEETPWAWVSNESMLKLSSVSADNLIFDYYPSPFVSDGSLNQVAVVLPETPGAADMEVMRGTLLTLGRFLKDNTGSIRVALSSQIGDLKTANVISIGRFDQNPIVRQINNLLFFQFSAGGTTLNSNEKMRIDPNYGTVLGTAQLLDSPYSEQKYGLLVISGVSDDAMLRGAEYVNYTDNLWKIYGDGLVSDGVDVFCYRFKQDNEKKTSPIDQLLTRTDIRNTAIAAGLVLMLTVTAVILLVWKYGKSRRDER